MTVIVANPLEATELLGLPYILSSQAQKHVTHNEALRALDALAQIAVASRTVSGPPVEPAPGTRHIVPDGASGAWAGEEGSLAAFQDGAWMHYAPRAGWVAWVEDERALLVHDGTGWVATGSGGGADPSDAVPVLGVNAAADAANRLAVASPGTLLSHEGSDHRLTINRAGAADTGSIVFQTGWSGRAEMGLAGADGWSLKVSADGAAWREALRADPATGALAAPGGLNGEHLAPNVASAGAAATVGGPPNMLTVSEGAFSLTLPKGRLNLSPFLVDRPTELVGAFVALPGASTDADAVLRAGVVRLGEADGGAGPGTWVPGERVCDLGTASAVAAGIKDFALAQPVVLEPGWYAGVLGCNGAGARVRYCRWRTPGTAQLMPYGSGGAADLRIAGPSGLLYADGQDALIANGLPSDWDAVPVSDLVTSIHATLVLLVPRWTRW